MSNASPETSSWRQALSERELRVLGALLEKQQTVPDTYPMTLKGLVSACNQSTSRDPVMSLGEGDVRPVLDDLKAARLVRFVHPSQGARATKFRHVCDEVWATSPAEQALLAVLMLRGPQTVNELRSRTERAHRFGSVAELEQSLEGLAARPEPMVVELGRAPGQRETRWCHLLGEEPPQTGRGADSSVPPPDRTEEASGSAPVAIAGPPRRVGEARADLERLAADVERLGRLVDHLYRVLGEAVPADDSEAEPLEDP